MRAVVPERLVRAEALSELKHRTSRQTTSLQTLTGTYGNLSTSTSVHAWFQKNRATFCTMSKGIRCTDCVNKQARRWPHHRVLRCCGTWVRLLVGSWAFSCTRRRGFVCRPRRREPRHSVIRAWRSQFVICDLSRLIRAGAERGRTAAAYHETCARRASRHQKTILWRGRVTNERT